MLKDRIIWSDNGVMKDLSKVLNEIPGSQVIPFVTAEDYIYFGSYLPFNHRWMEVKVANDVVATPAIDVWDGVTWQPVIEVIDETVVAGVSLAQSGVLGWVPNREKNWVRQDTKFNSVEITGLGTLNIYDLHWVRLKWNANLKATLELSFVGQKFSQDTDLEYIGYPDLVKTNSYIQYKAGTTSWLNQHFEAAKQVAKDLVSRKVITNKDQILDWNIFRIPATHKVAEMLFRGFGPDFDEQRRSARKAYDDSLNLDIMNLDKNKNAILEPQEQKSRQGNLSR